MAKMLVDKTIALLQDQLHNCSDLVVRNFKTVKGQRGALLFLEGLTNVEELNQFVFPELLKKGETENITLLMLENTFPITQLNFSTEKKEILEEILNGKTLLIMEKIPACCMISMQKWVQRNPEEPSIEPSIKGSMEGFVENLSVNLSIMRRYVKDPRLHIERLKIGTLAKTNIALLYIEDVANPNIIDEVKIRLKSVETEDLIASSELQQWINDNEWSLFPQIRISERPDASAKSLTSGKVIIFTENSPFALHVPFTFFESLQSSDDYFETWYVSTMIRFVRLSAFFISLLTPALYVALIHYNPELIPSDLLFSIFIAREQVPFPAVWELLLMELTIEIFREAGIRLPKPMGQTVGIVGGIVIGDAAVQANIISTITLIVVAITTMASFSNPIYSMALSFRLLRLYLTICASLFGLFGFVLGMLVVIVHLSSLKSFGVPYLTPLAPLRWKDWIDQLIIFPVRLRVKRPSYTSSNVIKGKKKPLKRG